MLMNRRELLKLAGIAAVCPKQALLRLPKKGLDGLDLFAGGVVDISPTNPGYVLYHLALSVLPPDRIDHEAFIAIAGSCTEKLDPDEVPTETVLDAMGYLADKCKVGVWFDGSTGIMSVMTENEAIGWFNNGEV